MHVLGGLAFFVAAERLTAAALLASDIQLPASVTALCAIGVVAAHPAAGRVLQAALGPGTVWMRAGLPCTLVPAFLFPAICELPDSEALPKLAVLGVGGILATCAITGHVAAIVAAATASSRTMMAAEAASAPCAASSSAAAAMFASPLTALAALGLGVGLSAALGAVASSLIWGSESELPRPMVLAPAYMGLTLALYVLANRILPPNLRKWCTPNVGCAMLLVPLLLSLGGGASDRVKEYLDGAGRCMLWASQPAMVTLGLYSHTHRAVLLSQAPALGALAVAGPLILFGIAYSGAALGLAPQHVASLLPASTTTGLALTMPSGFPLIQTEWVAAGTAFNSGLVQVSAPLLLAITQLRSPFARGVGIGSVAHIGGMVALLGMGEVAAADASAVALVVVGVSRAVLLQVPAFTRALASACGDTDQPACDGPNTRYAMSVHKADK